MTAGQSARLLALLDLADEMPALEDLAGFLTDPDPAVRGNALVVLSETTEQWAAASPVFASALTDPDRAVRITALELLREMREVLVPGDAFTAALRAASKHADPGVRAAAVDALWRHRLSTVGELTAAARDAAETVRCAAVAGLVSLDALDALAGVARDHAPSVRLAVARGLAALADPRGLTTLAMLGKDDDMLVRAAALEAMARTGCAGQAVTIARDGLTDPAWQVRQAAAGALARADSPDAVGPLTEATRDANLDVRKAAVRALGPWLPGRPGVRAALESALADPDADVRAFARMCLTEDNRHRPEG